MSTQVIPSIIAVAYGGYDEQRLARQRLCKLGYVNPGPGQRYVTRLMFGIVDINELTRRLGRGILNTREPIKQVATGN